MPSLAQVLARPRKASRQSRPTSLRVPPLTLRLVTWQRMSFSDPLVERDLGSVEHHQQLGLIGIEPREQTVEGDEAGLAREDAIEPRPQHGLSSLDGVAAIGLELSVE